MIAINIENISTLKNAGQAAEQNYCYTVTGEVRKPDHVPFDMGSDIPEKNASVKASRFTLVSGRLVNGNDFQTLWAEYEKRVHSTTFVYVTKQYTAYEMTITEFKQFVFTFCFLDRDSQKNGGGVKIRCKAETKAMLEYLASRAN